MTNWFTLRDVKEIRDQYYCKGHDDGYKLGWKDCKEDNEQEKRFLEENLNKVTGELRGTGSKIEKLRKNNDKLHYENVEYFRKIHELRTDLNNKIKWLVWFVTISIIELGVILVLSI